MISPPNQFQVPEGQVRSRPRTTVHKHDDGTMSGVRFHHPWEVLPHGINNKQELDGFLQHYRHQMPWMDNSGHPQSQEALRYMIEWVYPTLRWYCRVHKEKIPKWLRGNGWADKLKGKDRTRLIGDEPLRVQEWHEDPRFAGERG